MKFLISFLFVFSIFGQGAQWKLAKNSEGIKVYTREFENSDIKEFKAVTIVNTPIKNIENLLDNTEKLYTWMENVKESRSLKQIGSQSQYVYFVIKFPWPFSDRDMILKETKERKSDGTITYVSQSVPDFIPEKDDYERMKVAKGMWKLSPLSENRTQVFYQFYGDPAGSIPNWLVNLFIVDGPYKTLKNIKEKFEN